MALVIDDIAQDRLKAGILTPDALEDCFNCAQCSATVLPWQLRCEGCGNNNPREVPTVTVRCVECGDEWEVTRAEARDWDPARHRCPDAEELAGGPTSDT